MFFCHLSFNAMTMPNILIEEIYLVGIDMIGKNECAKLGLVEVFLCNSVYVYNVSILMLCRSIFG